MSSSGDYALQSGRLWVAGRLREMAVQAHAVIWDFSWTSAMGRHELTVRSRAGCHAIVVEDPVLRRLLDTFTIRPAFEARLHSLIDEIVVANKRKPG
jgi:hypothetical protein